MALVVSDVDITYCYPLHKCNHDSTKLSQRIPFCHTIFNSLMTSSMKQYYNGHSFLYSINYSLTFSWGSMKPSKKPEPETFDKSLPFLSLYLLFVK